MCEWREGCGMGRRDVCECGMCVGMGWDGRDMCECGGERGGMCVCMNEKVSCIT